MRKMESLVGKEYKMSIIIDEFKGEDGKNWCKLKCICGNIFFKKRTYILNANSCGKRYDNFNCGCYRISSAIKNSLVGKNISGCIVMGVEKTTKHRTTSYKIKCIEHGTIFYKKKNVVDKNNSFKNSCKKCIKNKSVFFTHPEVVKEWHPTKNKTNPDEIACGSSKKIWFKCKFGHEWETSIYNRTVLGCQCPKCTSHASRLEARIFSEFKVIFKDVKWGSKINNRECDVLIDDLKLALEIDGSYWHGSTVEKDKEKNKTFRKAGYKVMRIREKPLDKLGSYDIIHKKAGGNDVGTMKRIIKMIDKIYKTDYIRFYEKNEFLNNYEYIKLSKTRKKINKESIKGIFPKRILNEFDYNKNYPLIPEDISKGSHINIWWKCSKGHSWATPSFERYGRGGNYTTGCPYCSGRRTCKDTLFKTKYPFLATFFDFNKNKENIDNIYFKSRKSFFWKCSCGYSWVRSLTMIRKTAIKNGTVCPLCDIRNKSMFKKYSFLLNDWDYGKNLEDPKEVTYSGRSKYYWTDQKHMVTICSKSKQKKYKQYKEKKDV